LSLVNWMAAREVARYYGLNHIGKGIVKLADYADSIFGAGKPIYMRPSFFTVAVFSGVLPLVAYLRKWSWDTREIINIIGGYVSTKIWDWVEEVAAGFFKIATREVTFQPTVSIPPAPAPAQEVKTTVLLRK